MPTFTTLATIAVAALTAHPALAFVPAAAVECSPSTPITNVRVLSLQERADLLQAARTLVATLSAGDVASTNSTTLPPLATDDLAVHQLVLALEASGTSSAAAQRPQPNTPPPLPAPGIDERSPAPAGVGEIVSAAAAATAPDAGGRQCQPAGVGAGGSTEPTGTTFQEDVGPDGAPPTSDAQPFDSTGTDPAPATTRRASPHVATDGASGAGADLDAQITAPAAWEGLAQDLTNALATTQDPAAARLAARLTALEHTTGASTSSSTAAAAGADLDAQISAPAVWEGLAQDLTDALATTQDPAAARLAARLTALGRSTSASADANGATEASSVDDDPSASTGAAEDDRAGDTADDASTTTAPNDRDIDSAYSRSEGDTARPVTSGNSSAQEPSSEATQVATAAGTDQAPQQVVATAGATIEVADDQQLDEALAAAQPGDTIRMAPGTYQPVVITGSGTADAPITLTGPANAVIAGSGTGYTVHLDGASHWQLVGFSVSGGGKGVMTDASTGVLLDSLTVSDTGDEAVHFRGGSSDNTIQRSTIRNTGLAQPEYGEGVYVGSAKSNWKTYSGGQPDLSMNNRVVGNTFEKITAENVDVKEETGGTLIAGNRFDGSATSGKNYADSIVDVKGHAATVVDNVTTGSSPQLKNIIETHIITDPGTSGCGNTIEGNTTQGFTPLGALVAPDEKCVG